MRLLVAFLAALLLASSPAQAAIGFSPADIGSNSALAGSATLLITTTAACPVGGLVIVALGETGANTGFVSVTDSVSNTYANANTQAGTLSRTGIYSTGNANAPNVGLPVGSTITLTYGSSAVLQAAKAICWPGYWMGQNARDSVGLGATATSANPAVNPPATLMPSAMQIVATTLTLGGGDTWTESTGYTAFTGVLNTIALRVAWQTVSGTSPTAYSATNGASRLWTEIAIAFRVGSCGVATTGGGLC